VYETGLAGVKREFMLRLYFDIILLILLVNVFIVNAIYMKHFVNIFQMKLNGTEWLYCADLPLIIYSLITFVCLKLVTFICTGLMFMHKHII